MELIFLAFALGISIATAVLASRKGRNSINWFFLSIFWGIVGLIVLACSKHLVENSLIFAPFRPL